MKTQVTIELTDEQRLAVGLLETGKMIPATRDEVRSYVAEITMASVNTATGAILKAQKEVREFLGVNSTE